MRTVTAIGILIIVLSAGYSYGATTKRPFKTIKIQSTPTDVTFDMILASVVGQFLPEDIQKLKDHPDAAVKASSATVFKLNQRDVIRVELSGPDFCGMSGNCPSGLVVKSGYEYFNIFSGGGIGTDFITSKHNGFNDIVTQWHMSVFETQINIYQYDGRMYKAVKQLWQVNDAHGKHVKYLSNAEHDKWTQRRFKNF